MENKIRKTTSKRIYYTYCFYCSKKLINNQSKYCSRKCKDKHIRELKPEHYRKLKRDLYKKNPEKFRKQSSNWRSLNKEQHNKENKLWRQNNKEKYLKINKLSAIRNNHNYKNEFWKISSNKKLREKFILLKNNKCELCGKTKDLQIHHKKYTNNFDDWMLVCRSCHYKIHKDL